ncbi:MAG: HEAT repeat domain-containing protein, partial [Actinomycetota bacterium]
MAVTPHSPTPKRGALEPDPIGSALPAYWSAQLQEDGLRVVPPASSAERAFLLLLMVLLAGGFVPSPGAWWQSTWISLAATCGLWLAVSLPRTEWLIGSNFLEVRRSFQGRKWVERRFQNASLRATKGGGEYWALQVCDQENVRQLCAPESVEQLVQVADIIAAQTGWTLTSPDGSTAVLRELLNRALDSKDTRRLARLLEEEEAAATVAIIWRGRSVTSRRGVAERLAQATDVTALLLRAAESADWQARVAAVELLGEHGEPVATPRIRQALSDS